MRGARAAACALALLVGCVASCEAFYPKDGPVKLLDDTNFKSSLKEDGIWLVEFFAPWCGHCKNLAPDWTKAAKALKGIVHVAGVDGDQSKAVLSAQEVKGFPTIKAFVVQGGKVKKTIEYQGARTAKDIATFALSTAKDAVIKKIDGKKGKKGKKEKKEKKGGDKPAPPPSAGFYKGTDVHELGTKDFAQKVVKGEDMWFVEFYAPWCGHCKQLKPAYIEAAKQLKGKVSFAAVNCDDEANRPVCSNYGVKAFPTLQFFGSNKNRPEAYKGQRDVKAITEYSLGEWQKVQKVEIAELVDAKGLADHCVGGDGVEPKQLCVLAFLPDLMDSGAAGRNKYISVLENVAKANSAYPYSYLWMAAGSQPALERNFNVGGYGYPAMAIFSPRKEAFAQLKASFTKKEVSELLKSLRRSKAIVQEITGSLGAVVPMEPWDGGEAKVEDSGEIPLDELMREEL